MINHLMDRLFSIRRDLEDERVSSIFNGQAVKFISDRTRCGLHSHLCVYKDGTDHQVIRFCFAKEEKELRRAGASCITNSMKAFIKWNVYFAL